MSDSPRTPRLLRGAIIGLDLFNPLASLVIFQYNPERLTRTITPTTNDRYGTLAPGEATRLTGPPAEDISAEIELDATDQLESGKSPATILGIHPTLAALEMLVYPKSALVIASEVLAALGIIEVVPPEAPLTLFVWGPARVVPVRLQSMTITEEAFDPNLNPIRANVSLSMRVLTYRDLGLLSPGGAVFMAHQIVKEAMATLNGVGALSAAGSFSLTAGGSIGGG